MTNPETSRRIEVKDEADHTVAVAEVSTDTGPEGTVRTSIYAKSEHVRPGDRASLVDAVMDLPEVRASERLEATLVYGDAESVERLRQRTVDAELRAAGGTTLLDANIPSANIPSAGNPPANIPSAGNPPADEQRAGEQPPADA